MCAELLLGLAGFIGSFGTISRSAVCAITRFPPLRTQKEAPVAGRMV
jgi:hypothetical protein